MDNVTCATVKFIVINALPYILAALGILAILIGALAIHFGLWHPSFAKHR